MKWYLHVNEGESFMARWLMTCSPVLRYRRRLLSHRDVKLFSIYSSQSVDGILPFTQYSVCAVKSQTTKQLHSVLMDCVTQERLHIHTTYISIKHKHFISAVCILSKTTTNCILSVYIKSHLHYSVLFPNQTSKL